MGFILDNFLSRLLIDASTDLSKPYEGQTATGRWFFSFDDWFNHFLWPPSRMSIDLLRQLDGDHRTAMRRVLLLLLVLALFQLVAWMIPVTPGAKGIAGYLPLHSLMETISIVIAMMVFAVGWNSHTGKTTGNLMLLACLFFIIGCLDFSHTASYTGMPDFISTNGPDKHLNFWIAARLLAASALLIAALRPWNLEIGKVGRFVLFLSLLASVVVFNWIVIFYHNDLPDLFIPGKGLTQLKKNLEYLCIAINLVTLLLLWRRMRTPQAVNAPLLFAAAGIMAMSEFYFTLYTTMTGAYNVLGHIYKVISYLLIYRAVVVESIERPYLQLTQARKTLQQSLTEREMSQGRLQESEFFMGSLLDHVPGMVAYWTADLRCAFANEHYLEWFGRSKEQMRSITMQELMGPALFAKNEPMIRAALRGERQQFERTLTKQSGDLSYTVAQYIPTLNNGVVRGFLALVSDATESKLVQLRLERLNGELERRSDQLEAANLAKSQFLANTSHEIRTPMNAVLGLVQLLEKSNLTPQQSVYVGKTGFAAKALLAILNDILDFSKIEAGKLELEVAPFELDQLLRSLEAILSGSTGDKPVEVLFDVDARIPSHVCGDMLRLQQVLLNLTSNAVKFTHQGEVVLALHVLHADTDVVEIAFSVRDTGIGIAATELNNIFNGFSQAEASTTRRFGGTGLGLAISKELVELMGGELRVTSEPGIGSTFCFNAVFNAVTPATIQQNASAARPDDYARGKPRNVLVVDDNPTASRPTVRRAGQLKGVRLLLVEDNGMSQEVARELLEGEDAIVTLAENGQVCLDVLQSPGAVFDLTLMDIQMPVMDGLTAARFIRRIPALQNLPIVAMTANASVADREASRAAGMNDHVAKPFDLAELVRVIQQHTTQSGGFQANAAPAPRPSTSTVLPHQVRDLAAASGLEIEDALARFNGNQLVFVKALKSFVAGTSTMLQSLETAFDSADHEQVSRILHSLNGLASTVGAMPLAKLVLALETDLRGDGILRPGALAQLKIMLTAQTEPMATIVAVLTAQQPGKPPNRAMRAFDVSSMAAQLQTLRRLLQAYDLAAVSLADSLGTQVADMAPGVWAHLVQAMDRLDFSTAGQYCEDLMQLCDAASIWPAQMDAH
ncbi:MAG: response regulator [Herminiimonas sp.]|nr:response regulator [Herminiimonas sp.]